jgi:predicted DNA-binding antitoxin AbrB/MazE fold protein
MSTVVRATYENQALHLEAPLPIQEGATIEVTLNLPETLPIPRKRFSWEKGPILHKDSYSGDIADEVRRQRDRE